MKRIITLALFIVSSFVAKSQRATFKADTAKYKGAAYVVGDTIRLTNGSQPDKSFAFINIDSKKNGLSELDRTAANTKAVIDKIYVEKKVIFISASFPGKAGDDNKILIDLEAAVDNKEIK